MQKRFSTRVPALMASGALVFVDTSTLPQKDWKIHSGRAIVAGEEVHSLKTQKIAGTNALVIEATGGKQLSVTRGEAEVFACDYLTELGYEIKAPRIIG